MGARKGLGGCFMEITKFLPPFLAIQTATQNTTSFPASRGPAVPWVGRKTLSAVNCPHHKNMASSRFEVLTRLNMT